MTLREVLEKTGNGMYVDICMFTTANPANLKTLFYGTALSAYEHREEFKNEDGYSYWPRSVQELSTYIDDNNGRPVLMIRLKTY